MLMLTHTYLLQKYLEQTGEPSPALDAYVYNIVPDLLTIHPDINSAQTHDLRRTIEIPAEYSGAAYVLFHLLLDDLAHYGHICPDCREEFDPDSQGYSYIKGRPLIKPMLNLYKKSHREITYNEAAYRSHLIIEMLYDLAMTAKINSSRTIELLAEAIEFTAKNKMPEFIRTMKWLYDLQDAQIIEVMKEAAVYLTRERITMFMNMEGRINLYANKFGAKASEKVLYAGVKDLFMQASILLEQDDDIFLRQSAKIIREYGWLPPVT